MICRGDGPGEPGSDPQEDLRALADWFDDPKNPEVMLDTGRWRRVTAGYALRRIADTLEQAQENEDG